MARLTDDPLDGSEGCLTCHRALYLKDADENGNCELCRVLPIHHIKQDLEEVAPTVTSNGPSAINTPVQKK